MPTMSVNQARRSQHDQAPADIIHGATALVRFGAAISRAKNGRDREDDDDDVEHPAAGGDERHARCCR